ncbi:Chitinase, partial [hydrothermal vent metagenome]
MTKTHMLVKLFLSLFFLMLYACGGNDTDKNITDNKATAELPAGLQKLALGDGGTLNAYITVDGDEASRATMTIDPAGAGSASLVIDGLTRARHEITISYEYTTLAGATYVLASASQTIDLSSGSARLSFASSGYEIDQYDDDEDGSNNAAELKAGTNPNDNTDTPHLVFNSGFAKSVAENTTATGYQAVVAAADDAPVRYTLIGGLDQDKFRIDPATGILSFTDARDFENPQDSDRNNIYEVIIEAVHQEDPAAVSTQTALITVNDILNDNAEGNRPFITVWKTDNPGVSEDDQVRIGIKGGGYNFNIDWGDGKVDENLTENLDSPALATTFTHQYEEPGIYTISINGIFPRIYFETFNPDDTSNPEVQTDYDYDKILSIVQWGDIKWQSMDHAFFRCTNLAGNATDNPDLSQVTDMNEMFYGASKFNQDISGWDVSGVTTMSAMFFEASSFNQDVGGWDVSSVTTMRKMF